MVQFEVKGPKDLSPDYRVLKDSDKMNLLERLYIPEVIRGLGITTRHFFEALFFPKTKRVTYQYPEQTKPYPERFRGRHRLTLKEDGSPRCTACMLCATNCPAMCITIVAGEHEDPSVEKYPKSYEINSLRCIFCGMCVEACPLDAIRMDTGMHGPAEYERRDFVDTKEALMERSRVLAEKAQSKAA